MKSIRLFVLAAVLPVISTGIANARGVRAWPYAELLEKSDLVVMAIPIAAQDTAEKIDLPGFPGEHVVGVETTFSVSAVLKGDQTKTNLVLHHYRTANGPFTVNGPTFISFVAVKAPTEIQRTYILFLHREGDGRYEPVVGQTDPALAVKLIGVDETQTEEISDILRQCQTIKPGMTRAELLTVFTTEGGVYTLTHRRYGYRGCPYVKVNVDFTLSVPNQDKERPTDVIKTISTPFLEWGISD